MNAIAPTTPTAALDPRDLSSAARTLLRILAGGEQTEDHCIHEMRIRGRDEVDFELAVDELFEHDAIRSWVVEVVQPDPRGRRTVPTLRRVR